MGISRIFSTIYIADTILLFIFPSFALRNNHISDTFFQQIAAPFFPQSLRSVRFAVF